MTDISSQITIHSAQEHNLQNITLSLPKNKLIVFTGVSGSGKSSLAFDTIYAEGQRRYLESLSSYARQFLGPLKKPAVAKITGLSPTIAIDQKTASHNPRSTVGTVTEIYDYLRLLYTHLGTPHCPHCRTPITSLSQNEIYHKITSLITRSTTLTILAPLVHQQKGEFKDLFQNLLQKGYSTVEIDKQTYSLLKIPYLFKNNPHDINLIIDSFPVSPSLLSTSAELTSRLQTAISQALTLSNGLVMVRSPHFQHTFSQKLACPTCNFALPKLEPRLFSFNSPLGACSRCKGLGKILQISPHKIINPALSIRQGGLLPFNYFFFKDTWFSRLLTLVAQDIGLDLNTPLGQVDPHKLDLLLYGNNKTYQVTGSNRQGQPTTITEKFTGLINKLENLYHHSPNPKTLHLLKKYTVLTTCPLCHGARLNPTSLAVTLDNFNISQLTAFSVNDLLNYFTHLPNSLSPSQQKIAQPLLKEITTRLNFLARIGLGYLTLSRSTNTLSGGERQRIRLASQLGTGLSGILYVLDEPSIGLHPKDVTALVTTLQELTRQGNTVLVVEHDETIIRQADYLVELGPLAGQQGGHVVAQGSLHDLNQAHTLTAQYLNNHKSLLLPPLKVKPHAYLELTQVTHHNLKKVNLKIPLPSFTVVTGVSGSGKSSLITDTLYPALRYYLHQSFTNKMGSFQKLNGYHYLSRVYLVDQSPIGKTPRSNPATYIGVFDDIRTLFASTSTAKMKGFTKSHFSFNLKGGRCQKCQGAGLIKIEMQFLPDVFVTCDACQGQRYNQDILTVTYKGKNIYQVLEMTIDDALAFFSAHLAIKNKLQVLHDIGLGYLKLGQPAPTLSGGEAQRLKLALEVMKSSRQNTLYIMDEPTTGLHFYDLEKLLKIIFTLVKKGHTVLVIEHNLHLIKNAQYIVDLGPEGGSRGGEILYQGPLQGILNNKRSYTAKYLTSLIK